MPIATQESMLRFFLFVEQNYSDVWFDIITIIEITSIICEDIAIKTNKHEQEVDVDDTTGKMFKQI